MAEENTNTFTQQVGNEIERLAGRGEAPPSPQQQVSPMPIIEREYYTADEFLAEDYEPVPRIYQDTRGGKDYPVIPVGLGIIAGVGGCNKSTLLRQLAMSVVSGKPFLGWEYTGKHRSAIYVSTEDPKPVAKNYIKTMNESICMSAEEAKRLRFIFSSDDILEKLDNQLSQAPADLVIIDAFIDVISGKQQNSASDTRAAMGPFASLAFKYNCTVILLHHTNKGTDNIPMSRDNVAGSQALVNKPRFAIEFRVNKTDKELRLFGFVKHNYCPQLYYQDSAMVLSMDENFVLNSTGQRVPFEETGDNGLRKKDGKYDNVLVDVLKVMRNNPTPISYGELKKAIMEFRDKGETTAENNIKHAVQKGAIKKNESGNYIISHDYE